MPKTTPIPTYDPHQVRQAAATRWPEILSHLAAIPTDLLDGRHHPCPKCGGHDRFRLFTDGSGGAFCNQCLTSKNGDGFAALQWLTGDDFPTVLHQVASYIGIPPDPASKGKKRRSKADPAEHLVFDDDASTKIDTHPLVGLWCATHKPGISPAAIAVAHGRIATYRDHYRVIALPVFGQGGSGKKPVGWCLYSLTGGMLPKFVKGQPVDWVKVKLTYGSQPGWVGNVDRLEAATITWKAEGPTDALAALSLDGLPDNVAIIANANGAKEKPQPWMLNSLEDKTVYVLHDADKPGQEGATWIEQSHGQQRPGWCPLIAAKAKEVRNVMLPYEVVESKGKDLRDWVVG